MSKSLLRESWLWKEPLWSWCFKQYTLTRLQEKGKIGIFSGNYMFLQNQVELVGSSALSFLFLLPLHGMFCFDSETCVTPQETYFLASSPGKFLKSTARETLPLCVRTSRMWVMHMLSDTDDITSRCRDGWRLETLQKVAMRENLITAHFQNDTERNYNRVTKKEYHLKIIIIGVFK